MFSLVWRNNRQGFLQFGGVSTLFLCRTTFTWPQSCSFDPLWDALVLSCFFLLRPILIHVLVLTDEKIARLPPVLGSFKTKFSRNRLLWTQNLSSRLPLRCSCSRLILSSEPPPWLLLSSPLAKKMPGLLQVWRLFNFLNYQRNLPLPSYLALVLPPVSYLPLPAF